MRYLFWFIFGAAFCYLLANKEGLLIGVPKEIEAIVYGGLDGLFVAVATSGKLSWSLPLRFLAGTIWTMSLLAAYVFVFGSTSHRFHSGDIFWGLFFGLPASLICIVRGIRIPWSSRAPQ
jgi:hypothetical protein